MKLLFFRAPWCTACHAIEDKVPSYCEHIDCDVDQQTAIQYGISGLPCFVAVNSRGEEVARIQSTNVKMIDAWFKELKDDS
jgi:thiol-disulfide isomerase/thioredoxin